MSIRSAKAILNRTGSFSLQEKRHLKNVLDIVYADAGATGAALTTGAGSGITSGVGTVANSVVSSNNGIITTQLYIDLTGLNSGDTAGDIIGVNGAANSHFGRITTAQNGHIFEGYIACLETPATGEPNIDLFSAVEGTGAEDAAISTLDEVALAEAAGDWTAGTVAELTLLPRPNDYLYLVAGDATSATYTAGIFKIVLKGIDTSDLV